MVHHELLAWIHQLHMSVSNVASFAFSVPCVYNIILTRHSVLGYQQFILAYRKGRKPLAIFGDNVFLHIGKRIQTFL